MQSLLEIKNYEFLSLQFINMTSKYIAWFS